MDAGEPFLCRADPDAYSAAGVRPAEARALCAGCGFLEACRVYGLEHPELFGVWGGTTRRERQGMRRRSGTGERGPPRWSRVVGRCLWGRVPLVVSVRPGRRCAHRVTGRAGEGVTGDGRHGVDHGGDGGCG
ncbi:WhiB family transcriptional regulator [Streptomyces sp. NPDC006173]|uniref:WhiB family transcriptional regulator n=1 Tax=Streptomyces sp. NPDC006173 TaxID=3155349 RepID=UPI0033D6836E